MTTNEKVIGGIAAVAVILSLFGLVGGQSVSDEQIVQIAREVAKRVSSQTLGAGITRYPNSGIEALFFSATNGSTTVATVDGDRRISTTTNGWYQEVIISDTCADATTTLARLNNPFN